MAVECTGPGTSICGYMHISCVSAHLDTARSGWVRMLENGEDARDAGPSSLCSYLRALFLFCF